MPSHAGSRTGKPRRVHPGRRWGPSSSLSTRCAQMICSVVVMPRAARSSGQSIDGAVSTDFLKSRRPAPELPAPRRPPPPPRPRGPALVAFSLRRVGEAARDGIERELVAVLRIGDGLGTLHDVQAEIEG